MSAARWMEESAALSSPLGRRVVLDDSLLTTRAELLGLAEPGVWSANRSCRLVRAANGWIAVNLPRESDLESVPAWIGCEADAAPWPAILRAARMRPAEVLAKDAQLLGLAVSKVGSVPGGGGLKVHRMAAGGRAIASWPESPPLVIDLSSLWAGPLCGRLLTAVGARVIKVESRSRPDAMQASSAAFFHSLNAGKERLTLDFASAADLERLRGLIGRADAVITSARPRAFEQLGLTPKAAFAANPRLTWVAVTGHGWFGEAGHKVGFGDDAAAAAGLLAWTAAGRPRFAGDALGDPLTGLAATAAALEAMGQGGGVGPGPRQPTGDEFLIKSCHVLAVAFRAVVRRC